MSFFPTTLRGQPAYLLFIDLCSSLDMHRLTDISEGTTDTRDYKDCYQQQTIVFLDYVERGVNLVVYKVEILWLLIEPQLLSVLSMLFVLKAIDALLSVALIVIRIN